MPTLNITVWDDSKPRRDAPLEVITQVGAGAWSLHNGRYAGFNDVIRRCYRWLELGMTLDWSLT